MEWSLRKILCKQLNDKLLPIGSLIIPNVGWIKTIRKALGMSSAQLAKRMNISRQRIFEIENNEVNKHLTLKTLERVAENLNCRLIYAFIPKEELAQIVEKQASIKAKNELENISHSMNLEAQGVSKEHNKLQYELIKERLLSHNIKTIWD